MEAVNPDKLDSLLVALDDLGISLYNEPPELEVMLPAGASDEPRVHFEEEAPPKESMRVVSADDSSRWNEDPVRMYLTQMAEIPLLTREQEISLAKKIEVTRKRFRRTVLGCDYAMQATINTLASVHDGSLPFDRTIKVSLTERLTKEQIMARMPHNLKTLNHLLAENRVDFRVMISRKVPREERLQAQRRFLSRRDKALTLVEGAEPTDAARSAAGEPACGDLAADAGAASADRADRRLGRHEGRAVQSPQGAARSDADHAGRSRHAQEALRADAAAVPRL